MSLLIKVRNVFLFKILKKTYPMIKVGNHIIYQFNVMKLLNLKGTADTPSVILDPQKHELKFLGRSLPEDSVAFYNPILEWLDNYAIDNDEDTVAVFKLDYFSTSSSKMLLSILYKLESMSFSGTNVKVRWYYPEEDDDIEEAGAVYSELVELPFEHLSYSLD